MLAVDGTDAVRRDKLMVKESMEELLEQCGGVEVSGWEQMPRSSGWP